MQHQEPACLLPSPTPVFNMAALRSSLVHRQLINQNQRETNPVNTNKQCARVHGRETDKQRGRLRADSPQTCSPLLLSSGIAVIKIHTPDPLLCADSFLTACFVHLYSKTKRKERKKRKNIQNLHTYARIKMVMQHLFPVNKREHTEKERESERGQEGEKERERE